MGRHRDRKYGNVPVAAMMANGMSPYRPVPPPGVMAAMAMLPLMGFTAFIAGLITLLRRKRVPVAAQPQAPVAVAVPINSAVTLPTPIPTAIPTYSAGVATTGIATSTLANTCTTGTCATGTCATVGFNERLVAAERLPGVKVKEIDVVTRKKIPLHEVREIYEGPSTVEVFEGGQREYVSPEVGCATGYANGYAGQVCTTNCAPAVSYNTYAGPGIAQGGFAKGYSSGFAGEAITSNIANQELASAAAMTSYDPLPSSAAPIIHNRKVPIRERVLSKVTKRPVVTNYHS